MKTPAHNNAYTHLHPGEDSRGAAANDPQGRGGGSSEALPRTVIRGESFNRENFPDSGESYSLVSGHNGHATVISTPVPYLSAPALGAITDWLNCTFPLQETAQDINSFFRRFLSATSEIFAPLSETGRGLHGWKRSFNMGKSTGKFAIGGQRGKVYLSLPGTACALIPQSSWGKLIALLRDEYAATITRWDGAVDDYEGTHDVDWAVDQYRAGGFSSGGNRPSTSQQGDWLGERKDGRTIYIGKRKNGKLLRVYEKGKQLGNSESPWVRFELELHNRDRNIPWDVLIRPGNYVAGAFPCMRWITEDAERVRTTKNALQIGYDSLTFHAKRGYGRLLNVMLEHEGSPEAVLNKLIRPGKPARLDLPIPPEMAHNEFPAPEED